MLRRDATYEVSMLLLLTMQPEKELRLFLLLLLPALPCLALGLLRALLTKGVGPLHGARARRQRGRARREQGRWYEEEKAAAGAAVSVAVSVAFWMISATTVSFFLSFWLLRRRRPFL